MTSNNNNNNIVYRLDLTHTRSEGDRKEYRLIRLQNGLECLLVSTFSEQSLLLRRPSSGITEEQEEKIRKLSMSDRRFTTSYEQSRSVRTFSEERLKRKSDASTDSHQKYRSESKDENYHHAIIAEEEEEDQVDIVGGGEEQEEEDENNNDIGAPTSSLQHSPYLSSHPKSMRESSSKASGAYSSSARPQSRQPSLVGVVSGEAGRKLSQIFPPPSLPINNKNSFSIESSSIIPNSSSNNNNAIPSRISRTSIIESPRERPPGLRLSRLLGQSGVLFDFSTNAHSHLLDPSGNLNTATSQNEFGNQIASPRTHRTSMRSNSMASARTISVVFPTLPPEPDMCAVAMCVGVGSFATPEGLDGLAHFLEHMLFMGSEKYPKENEFDSLLTRAGGSSNAYTDTERTMYHFSVSQSHIKECLKVFAQFFISPLLLQEASLRELKSIESEFALRQNIDGCRLQEIWRETSRQDTPYSKFTCGNLQTLKENPEKNGLDVNKSLREFYDRYYVSGNMKFVIVSGESMTDLETSTSEILKDVRSGPKENLSLSNYGFPWKRYNPFTPNINSDHNCPASAGCCFRVPPTHDMHELQMTWQLPPQASLYKSKPTEFIAHALGHESAGSILAELKSRGWATALMAGVSPEDGFTNNTGVTLFNVTITLTSVGLSQWIFVAGLVFEFIGIMKRNGPMKWIHDELTEVAAMQYRFHEEPDARWMAQRLCIHMLPSTGYEKEHLLSGASLVFEWNPDDISQVMERLEPESVRIDLISSRLHENSDPNNSITTTNHSQQDDFGKLTLCQRPNRAPILERYTGAPYWIDPIPQPVIYSWRAVLTGKSTVGYSGITGEELFPKSLSLPPKNPFISSDFRLKSIRLYDYSEHFLIGAELRIKTVIRGETFNTNNRHISFGAKSRKSIMAWDLGIVLAFDKENDSILIKYPAKEGVKKWHKFDVNFPNSISDFQKNKPISMDYGKTFIRLTSNLDSLSKTKAEIELKVIQRREDYDEVADLVFPSGPSPDGGNSKSPMWSAFPRVPSAETSPSPTLVCGSDDFFSLWYLHDNTFRSPRVSAYLSFLTPIVAETALNAALADLFAVLVFESLNQESYMAFIVDLDFEIQVTGGLGIQLHFSGFSHKLPDLLKIVLRRTFFFTQWVSNSISNNTVNRLDFKRKSTANDNNSKTDNIIQEDNEFEAFFMAPDQDAPKEFDTPLFYARLEALLTDYVNAGSRFRSGNQVSSVMFDLLCDGLWTAEDKALAARSITPQMLVEFSNRVFANIKVEGLFQGNVDEKDASQFFKCVDACLKIRGSKPIKNGMEPKLRCQVIPVVSEKNQPVSGWIHILEAVESPSHSVELFFQIGPDNPEDRVLASTLEQLMREPLYSELRTKQQLGYSVKCGVRSVCGTLGFVVEITSDIHGPEILANDIDEFFTKLRLKLEQMPQDEYVLNLCGLASQFLEKSKNLGEAASRHWNCILAHAFYGLPYVWNSNLVDAALIKPIASKTKVLDAFGAWLDPNVGKRRRASVYVVGYGYHVDRLVKSLKRPWVKLVSHPRNTLSFGLNHSDHHHSNNVIKNSSSLNHHNRISISSRRSSTSRCEMM